jgi:uncharacterized protein (DUF697 family)
MSWLGTLKDAATGKTRKFSAHERERAARDLIQMSGFAAATVTYAPLPVVDFVAITPIQAAMVMALGRVYGRELTMKESTNVLIELGSVCGAGLLARQIWTAASKLILPGLGGILAGPYAFAVTWAMGRTAMKYFEDPSGSRERLKKSFTDALEEGRRFFSVEKLNEFRKKYERKVRDFAGGTKANGKSPAGGKRRKRKASSPKRQSAR